MEEERSESEVESVPETQPPVSTVADRMRVIYERVKTDPKFRMQFFIAVALVAGGVILLMRMRRQPKAPVPLAPPLPTPPPRAVLPQMLPQMRPQQPVPLMTADL